MKKTIKTPFQPTSKVRVVSRNRRTEVAHDAREPRNIKVRTNIHLDLDVIDYFKKRAKAPGGLPYQTQINAELRKVIERSGSEGIEDILHNERLILAIAKRVKELA